MARIFILSMLLVVGPAAANERIESAPERFFVGRLESSGTLKIIFRAPETVTDHGTGRVDPDGATVIDQVVERPGEPPRRRVWRLKQSTPGSVIGTLSGARGPVKGTLANGVLHLTYAMDDGVHVDQRLTFAPDGRTARNHMAFRKFGITVASLNGTIRRVDDR